MDKESPTETVKDEDYKLVPPNGGYGWFVCLGSGLLNVIKVLKTRSEIRLH